MLITTDYFEPATLTDYIRRRLADLPDNQNSLARWLPNRNVNDTQYRLARGARYLTGTAKYRAFDTPAKIAKRPEFSRVTGNIPPISDSLVVTEYNNIRNRIDGTDRLRDEILNDTDILVERIAKRLEVGRAEALVSGTLTLAENGINETLDFGRDPSMSVAPAGALWTNTATSDPFGDLRLWIEAYEDLNGDTPGALLTSSYVVGLMLANENIRERAGSVLGVPTEVTRDQLNAQLAARELPPIYTYKGKYEADNGTATRVIPQDKVLLLPAPVDPNAFGGTQLGSTMYGPTAESFEPEYNLAAGDQPGIVAGVYRSNNPINIWTVASALAMPVLANPNLSMVADVA